MTGSRKLETATDCAAQFGQIGGGNTRLEPERARSWLAGLVLRPGANVHVAAEELERHRAFIAKLVNPLWERLLPAGAVEDGLAQRDAALHLVHGEARRKELQRYFSA